MRRGQPRSATLAPERLLGRVHGPCSMVPGATTDAGFLFFWSSGNDIKGHSSSIPELLSPRASALLPPSFACSVCRCYLRIEGSLGLFRALKPFLFHWASRQRYAFLRVSLFVLDGGYFLRCPKADARIWGVALLLANVVKKKKSDAKLRSFPQGEVSQNYCLSRAEKQTKKQQKTWQAWRETLVFVFRVLIILVI